MARADRAFAVLVTLAVGSGLILLGLLGALWPRSTDLLSRGLEDIDGVVVGLVLLLATCGVALGLTSLVRQLFATAELIRSLLARRVPASHRVLIAAEGLGLDGRIDVVVDERSFSFCFWFLRPRICVSTALVRQLAREELRAVLLHERYHLRHRDPLRLIVARFFAAVLYVVPVLAELVAYYSLQKEIEADQEAVRESRGVRALAGALYKLLPGAEDLRLGLLVPVSALSVTETRIDQLLTGRAIAPRFSFGSVVLSFGTLAGAGVLAHLQACLFADCLSWPSHIPEIPTLAISAALLSLAAVTGGAAQLRAVITRG